MRNAESGSSSGLELLRRLRALAQVRIDRGDTRLLISPSSEPQEFVDFSESVVREPAGLVLEPEPGSPFEIRRLRTRHLGVEIGAFCDGTRATYFLGFEDILPLMYTENAAAVRMREASTGYHESLGGVVRSGATLLAPFGIFEPNIRVAYERMGLCQMRQADLCWFGDANDDQRGLTPDEMRGLGSLAWQGRGQRRARRLMEVSEQVAALAGVRTLRRRTEPGRSWLLKDGSLFQFEKEYLRQREPLRQVVAVVKTHPVPFFGAAGERAVARMGLGERSVAFMPRPQESDEVTSRRTALATLETSERPMVSWYLRVHEPEPQKADRLSGVVRLDISATSDWQTWVDEVSWAVLDEFHGLSARPDPRHDVLTYGVHECERFLRSQRISGDLLLASLSA